MTEIRANYPHSKNSKYARICTVNKSSIAQGTLNVPT